MRFIQFLVEAPQPKPPQQGDWIKKAAKADRQRARRATAKRGEANKQAMQANVSQPAGAKVPQANPDVIQPPPGNFQKVEKTKPAASIDNSLDAFLAAAKGNRGKALEMITLLGSIYQAKKRNPSVQLTVPKLVSDSEDKETMQKLFDVVKNRSLPELTAAYQEIKRAAAMPGQTPPPNGTQSAPATPGQTPAGKSMLQNLMNRIKQAAKSLSPQDLSVLRKEVDKAAQNAKPNPSNNTQQPIGKPVVTSG